MDEQYYRILDLARPIFYGSRVDFQQDRARPGMAAK
jgi:hypothetical protein